MTNTAEPRSHYDLIAYAAQIGYPDALAQEFSSWSSLMSSEVSFEQLRFLFERMTAAGELHRGAFEEPAIPTALYSVIAPPNDESYPIVLQPSGAGDGDMVWVEGTTVIELERVAARLDQGWTVVVHTPPAVPVTEPTDRESN